MSVAELSLHYLPCIRLNKIYITVSVNNLVNKTYIQNTSETKCTIHFCDIIIKINTQITYQYYMTYQYCSIVVGFR